MAGDGAKADGPGEDVTGHAENEEYGLRSAAEFPANLRHAEGLEEYLEGIRHVMNPGISLLELSNDISRVRCDYTKSKDEEETRNQPDGSEHGWQGQYP
jgi:hypothetical protein